MDIMGESGFIRVVNREPEIEWCPFLKVDFQEKFDFNVSIKPRMK